MRDCSNLEDVTTIYVDKYVAQELLDGFKQTQVAYLDLSLYPTAALQNAGPGSCVAGQLKLMPGMFGTPSQVHAHRLDPTPTRRQF